MLKLMLNQLALAAMMSSLFYSIPGEGIGNGKPLADATDPIPLHRGAISGSVAAIYDSADRLRGTATLIRINAKAKKLVFITTADRFKDRKSGETRNLGRLSLRLGEEVSDRGKLADFTFSVNDILFPDQYVPTEEFIKLQKTQKDLSQYNIALILIKLDGDKAIPKGLRAVRPAKESDGLIYQMPLVVAGFGATSSQQPDNTGKLNANLLLVHKPYGKRRVFGAWPPERWLQKKPGGGLCGVKEAGAPAFIAGSRRGDTRQRLTLLGLGYSPGGDKCEDSKANHFVDLRPYEKWIKARLKENKI